MDKGLEVLLLLKEKGLEFEVSSGEINVGINENEYLVYPENMRDFFTYVLNGSWMIKDLDSVGMEYNGNGTVVKVYDSDFGSREGYEMFSVDFEKYKAKIM